MAKSQVKGIEQTAQNLRSMRLIRRPVGEASRYSLQPVLQDAKIILATPKPGRPSGNVITGDLLASMKILQKKRTKGRTETVVSATGKGIRKAHLVEFGTDPHWQPKRGILHPGARPFPFLTPAFEKNDKKVMKRFTERFERAVEAQAARMLKKR